MSEQQTENQDTMKGAKVLIVDDVPKNIQVLGSVLRGEGFQVIPATSGPQALKAAEVHSPDLILLDVMMPEMSGHEVIVKLRENPDLADIPVIFITALTDDEDEAKGLELGAVDYITKPINIPITLSRVKTHLSLRLARKTLEEQNQQLIEAARLREDVERMSRHDLKTPLSVMLATPDLLIMAGNQTDEQTKLLKMIKNAAYRMLDMIDRSLDLYKMETGVYDFKPEPVDLIKVIGKIREETKDLARSKNCEIRVQMGDRPIGEDDTFQVTGEELLCYSMFANLVKNALEASPEGESISVSLQDGEKKTIRICNRGAVPQEIRDTFFEKYATSGKKHGTGLGTYSARLIAQTQCGSIRLDCGEDDTTTVTVELP